MSPPCAVSKLCSIPSLLGTASANACSCEWGIAIQMPVGSLSSCHVSSAADRTFTEPVTLRTELAALEGGKSYVNFQQDVSLPHSMPWHPRLSERLGLFQNAE